jgi:hypothetical protein
VFLVVDDRFKIILIQKLLDLINEECFYRPSRARSKLKITISRAPLFSKIGSLKPLIGADEVYKCKSIYAILMQSFPYVCFCFEKEAHFAQF